MKIGWPLLLIIARIRGDGDEEALSQEEMDFYYPILRVHLGRKLNTTLATFCHQYRTRKRI